MNPINESQLNTLYDMLKTEKKSGTLSQKKYDLWLVFGFAIDLVEGDLNDYFFNETGSTLEQLIKALTNLGATEVVSILEEALSLLDQPLPLDIESRQGRLMALNQDILEAWDELTEDYYDIEAEFWSLLVGQYKA